jgi:hypothetical protein
MEVTGNDVPIIECVVIIDCHVREQRNHRGAQLASASSSRQAYGVVRIEDCHGLAIVIVLEVAWTKIIHGECSAMVEDHNSASVLIKQFGATHKTPKDTETIPTAPKGSELNCFPPLKVTF